MASLENDKRKPADQLPSKDVSPRGLEIDPEHLIPSIADLYRTLPEGRSDYALDGNRLIPIDPNASIKAPGRNYPEHVIGIEKGPLTLIVADAGQIEFLSGRDPQLSLALHDNLTLKHAHFKNGYADPNLSLWLTNADGSRSNAVVDLMLVQQTSSLKLKYTGDYKMIQFDALDEYTEGQRALLLKDGTVPDIDVQQYIYDLLFLGDSQATRRLAVPTLTFNPDRNAYEAFRNRTYLVEQDGKKPVVELGKTISGITITERTNRPYRVDVQLKELVDVPQNYTGDIDRATLVWGEVTIYDGSQNPPLKSDEVFIVLADRLWLQDNPQLIPSKAFSTVFDK